MQKVKIYAWVIYRILVFYAKRHIYIAAALLSTTAVSLFKFATTGKLFCLALPFITALIIYVIFISNWMNLHHREFRDDIYVKSERPKKN